MVTRLPWIATSMVTFGFWFELPQPSDVIRLRSRGPLDPKHEIPYSLPPQYQSRMVAVPVRWAALIIEKVGYSLRQVLKPMRTRTAALCQPALALLSAFPRYTITDCCGARGSPEDMAPCAAHGSKD